MKRLGFETSVSTCGRIISWLIKRGEIMPSVLKERKGKRGAFRFRRPWAMRWSGGLRLKKPGDLVEVDTLTVTLSPGRVVKQFTARDVVSGWNVLYVVRPPQGYVERAQGIHRSKFTKAMICP